MPRRQTPDYVGQAKQMWRRGVSALDAGRASEAESWLRKAAAATPDDAATQHHLAEALWQTGKQDEALRCAEQACRCDPTNLPAVVRAGEMRLERGEAAEAVAWGDRAIDLEARSAQAWALRGRAHHRLGSHDQALADYQQALRYAPNDTSLLADLARLHTDRGDARRSLTTLHQLLDAYPPGQEPHEALRLAGDAYFTLGRARDAAETLELAAARGPADADLLCRLAEAQAACGRNDRALIDARRALAIDANHVASRQLVARLDAAGSAVR